MSAQPWPLAPYPDDAAQWPAGLPDPVRIAPSLFPNSEYLQTEYVRAVGIVRGTSRGWLLDNPVRRHAAR